MPAFGRFAKYLRKTGTATIAAKSPYRHRQVMASSGGKPVLLEIVPEWITQLSDFDHKPIV